MTTSTTSIATQTTTTSAPANITVPNVPASLIQALYPSTPETLNAYSYSGLPHPAIVQEFEAAFPNIHIAMAANEDPSGLLSGLATHTYIYDNFRILWTLMPQEIATGEVMNIAPWIDQYLPFLETQIAPAAWNSVANGQSSVATAGANGHAYCIPEDWAPVALMYREDIFNKYGLTVPTTWAQYAADAAKLHSENSSITMTVFPPNEIGGDLMGFFWQAGGNFIVPTGNNAYDVEINSTINMNVMNYWGNLINSGEVQAINMWTPQYNNELASSEIASLATAAAWYPGYAVEPIAPNEAGLWRVSDMPQWNSTTFVTGGIASSCFGVTANAKYPGASFIYSYYVTENPTVMPYMWQQSGQWSANSYWLQNLKYSNGTSVFFKNDTYFGGENIGTVYLKSQEHMGTQWVMSPFQITMQTILQEQLTEAAAKQITFTQLMQNLETIMISYIQNSGATISGVGH